LAALWSVRACGALGGPAKDVSVADALISNRHRRLASLGNGDPTWLGPADC
jgi:hypothetical protein